MLCKVLHAVTNRFTSEKKHKNWELNINIKFAKMFDIYQNGNDYKMLHYKSFYDVKYLGMIISN